MAAVEFDYDLTKNNYLKLINKFFDEDSSNSDKTISKTIEILRGPVKTNLHKNYRVSRSFGKDILIEKAKSPTDQAAQVLSFEDIFDVFIKFHTSNNHLGGRRHLLQVQNNFKCAYIYPSVCLSLLVKSCNVCKSKLQDQNKVTKVSSVYVTVMIQKRKSPIFKYVLIYIDKATDFVLLRPLQQRSEIEIVMEVFKILMCFGSPQKLCLHGYNKDFNIRVGMLLREVCPKFPFKIVYRSSNFDPSAVVVDKLQQWMTATSSMSWEIGCSIVQRELNMNLKSKIPTKGNKKLSPHELFYGTDVNRSRIENNVDKNIIKDIGETRAQQNKDGSIRPFDKIIIDTSIEPEESNHDIVELRIPSPDNFDTDILSQFDSDSQNAFTPGNMDLETDNEIEEDSILNTKDTIEDPNVKARRKKRSLNTKTIGKDSLALTSNDSDTSSEEKDNDNMSLHSESSVNSPKTIKIASPKNDDKTTGSFNEAKSFVIDDILNYDEPDLNLVETVDPLDIHNENI